MWKLSCHPVKATKMNPSFSSKLTLVAISIFLVGCEAKKNPQAKKEVSSIPVISHEDMMKAKHTIAAAGKTPETPSSKPNENSPPPGNDENKITDAERKQRAADELKIKQELEKQNALLLPPPVSKDANPLLNNRVLINTFTAYLKTGISDASIDAQDLNNQLTAPELKPEGQSTVFGKYIHVIEQLPPPGEKVGDNDFSKKVPVATRMKDVFDFYKNNAEFAKLINDKIKNEPILKILSEDEKKFATPFIYLSIIFGQTLKNSDNDFFGFNVSETTHADNKKFHTMILGRVEWYQGSKKKGLTKTDESRLSFIRDMTNAWLSSDASPSSAPTLKVIGYGEKDNNETANKVASKKRADMVHKFMTQMKPPFQGKYDVEGLGSDVILKPDPTDVKNRRIDIVISETEEPAANNTSNPPIENTEEK